ncbi:molybdopterin-binding/glycosyltransferase family 2 protein, partial [Aquibium sp. A9E412]|uniref:molybdopterin-binding/glycosyltransferase family 2 protein n=1 Tax=Aquibium sp. A9E412 TaxID=2976767 RepID=UPI0025B2228A
MRFGTIAVAEAEGAVLAHATTAGATRLRKAHRLTADDVAALAAAGVETVVAATLEPGDLDEDAAAGRLAAALVGAGIEAKPPATGRVNLHAREAGLFVVDRALVDAINRIDPTVTLATLDSHRAVEAGQMVATVKIIPFAVPEARVAAAVAAAHGRLVLDLRPFRPHRVGIAQTVLPNVKQSVLDKTARITAGRLARSGSTPGRELRPAHDEAAVAAAIADLAADSDMVVVFGASAVCDDDDVIPAAIRAAGGTVERVGMPVDPGNLLVLGRLGEVAVLGAPGCARSPRPNGFDWVLDRLCAGLDVTSDAIAGMGVGGLLMEIPTRPQPREPKPRAAGRPAVWTVLLAAGRSSRMGAGNKLLADFAGEPLVRRTARRCLAAQGAGVVAVLGHQADAVAAALAGLAVTTVVNPAYADGLAGSLRAGIAALPAKADGALVVLADMPQVTAADLDRLIAAFAASGGRAVVRATHDGKRGNPVILPRALFAEVARLQGDTGARHIVEAAPLETVDVELG